jgi:hypothetical protein
MRKGYEGRAHRDCQPQSCQFTVHSPQFTVRIRYGDRVLAVTRTTGTEDREQIVSNPRGP